MNLSKQTLKLSNFNNEIPIIIDNKFKEKWEYSNISLYKTTNFYLKVSCFN